MLRHLRLRLTLFVILTVTGIAVATAESRLAGDANRDGIVDVDDLNIILNAMTRSVTLTGDDFACVDLVADGVIDIDDVNALINIIIRRSGSPEAKAWLKLEPTIIAGKMISTSGAITAFGNGRLLVWPVQAGDTLRLSIDHDNSIGVNMRSFMIYNSNDPTQWTTENALATGCNLKAVDGQRIYDPLVVPSGASVLVCSGFWYENGRVGDGGSAALNPYTAFMLEKWVEASLVPPRTTMRVLAIGNSFTCDELSYVPYVMQSIAPDVDLHLRLFVRPDGTLAKWAAALDSVMLGNYYDWQPFPGRWTTPEKGVIHEQVVADQWDVITLQQASFRPYWHEVKTPLTTITTWLRDSMDYHGRIDWVLNHAYSDSNILMNGVFPQLHNGDEMWQLTQAIADSVMRNGFADRLLPSGTAVQNARHTRLRHFSRNQLCAGSWAPGKSGDNHLQEGIGPFTAACAIAGAWAEVSPIGAQVQLSSTWRIPSASPSYLNAAVDPTLEQIDKQKGGLGMDPESQALGAWCADQALQHPFELIEYQTEDE